MLTFSNGEKIETAKEHPFYVKGRGFTPAGEMGIGTSIVTRAGPSVQLVSSSVGKAQKVFNFEVEDFHSYFVGAAEAWVHNADYSLKWPVKGSLVNVMANSGYKPGQYRISAATVNDYIAQMKAGTFNWNNVDDPILVDANGVITGGHHRIVAAILSGTPIPPGSIGRGTTFTSPPIGWDKVWVLQ